MTRFWLFLALLVLAPAGVSAKKGVFGDDNPYPLACMDFTGNWQSDNGEVLTIVQGNQCKWLRLSGSLDSKDVVTTIFPDDVARDIAGGQWKGTVRHRWNNKKYATVIETHRILHYPGKVVTELVLLEKVNDKLLLESTYRKEEPVLEEGEEGGDCEPKQEYHQRVFRYQHGAEHR